MILFQGFWCSGKSKVGSDTSEAVEEVLSVSQSSRVVDVVENKLDWNMQSE